MREANNGWPRKKRAVEIGELRF